MHERGVGIKVARVAKYDVPGVERDRGDSALVDDDLDAPTNERGIQAVVVRSTRRCGSGGTRVVQRHAVAGIRAVNGAIAAKLVGEAVDRPGAQRLIGTRGWTRDSPRSSRTGTSDGGDSQPGSIPGSKLSATEGNSAQLKAAQEREIELRSAGTLRLGAGRSQVQILSPRSTRKARKCGPFGFLTRCRQAAAGVQLLHRGVELLHAPPYGAHATKLRIRPALHQVRRVLRPMACSRRPLPQPPNRQRSPARGQGGDNSVGGRAGDAAADRGGSAAASARRRSADEDCRRGRRSTPAATVDRRI